MSIKEKIMASKAAIRNIWSEHHFTFDPGTPIKPFSQCHLKQEKLLALNCKDSRLTFIVT